MAASVRHLKIFSQGRACTAKRTLDGHQKKYAFGKRLRASFLPLTLWRPDAVLWGFLWPFTSLLIHQGGWNHFPSFRRTMSPAINISSAAPRPSPLRGELRSALTARAAVASCACERWLRGMKGSGFVQLRCMEVYRGYSRY